MSKSTPMYDDNPALVGGQSKLPDVVQKAIIKKKMKAVKGKEKQAAHGGEYDDSHMLSKSLERMASQAMHLKHKLDCGLVLPSWAEYKIYKAYDSVNSALGASYPGKYPMGMNTSAVAGKPSPMIVKAAAHCMAKHKKKKKPLVKKAASVKQLRRTVAGAAKKIHPSRTGYNTLPGNLEGFHFQPAKRKKASVEQEVLKALTDEGGAAGMGAIKKRVSSPELAAAMKRLMAQGKIHKHRDGDIIKK